MYSVLPSFVLGFHGCDEKVANSVITGTAHLKPSRNKFDWLGEGIYFWENSPARALEYATFLRDHPRKRGPRIATPAVVGAVVSLGSGLRHRNHIQICVRNLRCIKGYFRPLDEPEPSVAEQ